MQGFVPFDLLLGLTADVLSTGERPVRGLTTLHEETLVPASLDDTFEFFSDARNLERLTPAWLKFQVRSSGQLTMREGLEIDYVIVVRGIPIPWKTRIDVWEPGVRFVDRQVNGPYVWWRHEHRFEETERGTRVVDDVEFVPRLRWITGGIVRRDVQRIFFFRSEALRRIFVERELPNSQ